jgi:membrane-associated protease RseP (regulator of RpoE activity)
VRDDFDSSPQSLPSTPVWSGDDGDRLPAEHAGLGAESPSLGRAPSQTRALPHPMVDPTPAPLRISRRELVVAGGLLLLTLGSTYLTGGIEYALSLLGILLCHEMGHYLMARHYRVRSTLPIFLPLPFLSPFGTLGAVIKMRQHIRDRRVLYDIGIAGPLAGIVPAVAAIVWGLGHSVVIDREAIDGTLMLGDSLLSGWIQRAVFPDLGPDQDLLLHPVAFAGWAGLFVTALNLLPIGQLDGGHVAYGLLGRRSLYVSWMVIAALAVLGFYFPGWWFLLLILVLTRVRHPQTIDERVPLDRKRVALGIFALAFFVVSFIPTPIVLP